jgi:hypothetical protein
MPTRLDGMRVATGIDQSRVRRQGGQYNALRFPPTIPLAEADIPDDELALCVLRGDEARAYSTSILRRHHVVNDWIDGRGCLVTFCGQCSSGIAFEPTVGSLPLTLDVFGAYQGAMVMNDDQTGSLWAQFTGEAFAGRLTGQTLEPVPVQMMTVGQWLSRHPDSLTPDIPSGGQHLYFVPGAAPFARGWGNTISHLDDRLPPRALVLGVRAEGAARAYALPTGEPLGQPAMVHQDEVGGLPIVLLGADGVWPLAYSRRMPEGEVRLSFDGFRVKDASGSEWDMNGRATTGPLAGTELGFVPSHVSEWYAWAAYHPDTEIVDLRSS